MRFSFADLWPRVLVPAGLGVLAFVVVQLLIVRYDASGTDRSWAQTRPSKRVDATDVTLQVAVHDLIEAAPPAVAVRVCRSLADRVVTIHAAPTDTISATLESLARQAGSNVTLGLEHPHGPALPTIVCPDRRASDYLTIGTAHAPRAR